MSGAPLRLGILGAARHVPLTVIQPLRDNKDLAQRVEAVAVAAKELAEAEQFAKEHGIPKAYGSLEALLADPSIDAVYIVLPNNLRCEWTVRALLAGKHVLCETPLASNAREAVAVQRAAEDSGRVMMEGSHPTSHPVTKRVREMIHHGYIGKLQNIELSVPMAFTPADRTVCTKVGSLMALGIYCVSCARLLTNEEPVAIKGTAVRGRENAEVDETMKCELKFPSGATCSFTVSVDENDEKAKKVPALLTVHGSNGAIKVSEWFRGRSAANEIMLEQYDGGSEKTTERIDGSGRQTTFYWQLMSFCDEVRLQTARKSGAGMPWDYSDEVSTPSDAVRNMAVVDAIYRAAGMAPKSTAFMPPDPYKHVIAAKL